MQKPLVRYNEMNYFLLYRYSSDYCEIQDVNSQFKILLVHSSDVSLIPSKSDPVQ
ncbi:hypothetical protein [Bacillus sp. MRMR6]|uniref:hypothetical protein n=1 Tax=Bacillus sp. MRMR6 TaxID=1928617 RepID=UPI00158DA132|nr:hypothetical protein [Bacillus sp. MRMR6]